METLSLGMDLHKSFSVMAVVNQQGAVLHREKVDNTVEAMEAFFGNYHSESCEVAVEATWNWYWVYELLERMHFPVHLVHAERARAIASAKIKTDKIDSEILAQLLRMDYLPEAHIASREARHRRERLRYRVFLIRVRTMLKHSIHTILAKTGVSSPYACLFTKRSREWLEGLSLEPCYKANLQLSLELIGHLDRAIASIEEWIQKEKVLDRRVEWLKSLHGIGDFSALLILSEIDTIDRFPNAKHFVSYTGLAPSLHSSGTVHRTGPITKKGNKWLRWILIEAAQHATQKRSPFFFHYQEVKRRKGAGKAVTAMAAKLARLVYQTLKKQEAFNIDLYRNKKNMRSQVQGREPVGVMVAS